MATPALIPQHVDDSECVTRVYVENKNISGRATAWGRIGVIPHHPAASCQKVAGSTYIDVVPWVRANHGLYVHTRLHVALITLSVSRVLSPLPPGDAALTVQISRSAPPSPYVQVLNRLFFSSSLWSHRESDSISETPYEFIADASRPRKSVVSTFRWRLTLASLRRLTMCRQLMVLQR